LDKNLYTQEIHISGDWTSNQNYKNFYNLISKALASLKVQLSEGSLGLLQLPDLFEDLEALESVAEYFIENFDDVIVLGTGGSSLGGKAINQLADSSNINGPNLHFIDSIDPRTFVSLLNKIIPEKTGFIVISKSGQTTETIAQFLLCLDIYQVNLDQQTIHNHFLIITEFSDNPLRRLANNLKLKIAKHNPDIGGRYSALSIVGLFPALVAGIDAYAIREGAKILLVQLKNAKSPEHFPPAMGALFNTALNIELGINSTVLMPYLDQLDLFSSWFQQLWAESLGKNGLGTTPIKALGTVDQHSQLQLYLDGPKDKIFTLILGQLKNQGGLISHDYSYDPDLKFIAGKRIGDLMDAHQEATAKTLINQECPTRLIRIKTLDEQTLGALLMHFMLETILTASVLNLNAFDQPAVEESKTLAKSYLLG
tara:strand:+ start:149 stop:1426 length:1278 start_codon:yes stop_codon:yes gene_type:complete